MMKTITVWVLQDGVEVVSSFQKPIVLIVIQRNVLAVEPLDGTGVVVVVVEIVLVTIHDDAEEKKWTCYHPKEDDHHHQQQLTNFIALKMITFRDNVVFGKKTKKSLSGQQPVPTHLGVVVVEEEDVGERLRGVEYSMAIDNQRVVAVFLVEPKTPSDKRSKNHILMKQLRLPPLNTTTMGMKDMITMKEEEMVIITIILLHVVLGVVAIEEVVDGFPVVDFIPGEDAADVDTPHLLQWWHQIKTKPSRKVVVVMMQPEIQSPRQRMPYIHLRLSRQIIMVVVAPATVILVHEGVDRHVDFLADWMLSKA
jgi:hypothetical protein